MLLYCKALSLVNMTNYSKDMIAYCSSKHILQQKATLKDLCRKYLCGTLLQHNYL